MVILYKRGLIYKEVMSDWRVVNTEFYVQVLEGGFPSDAAVSRERQFVPFCMIAPLLIMP